MRHAWTCGGDSVVIIGVVGRYDIVVEAVQKAPTHKSSNQATNPPRHQLRNNHQATELATKQAGKAAGKKASKSTATPS